MWQEANYDRKYMVGTRTETLRLMFVCAQRSFFHQILIAENKNDGGVRGVCSPFPRGKFLLSTRKTRNDPGIDETTQQVW